MNRPAFDALLEAQRAYLLANGWVEVGQDEWREPPGRRNRALRFGHAVNSQLFNDRGENRWRTPRDHCTRCREHYDNCGCDDAGADERRLSALDPPSRTSPVTLNRARTDPRRVKAMNRFADPWFQAHVDRASDYGDTVMVHTIEHLGVIVGMAMVDYLPKCGIVIDPLYRRKGFGRELMRRVVKFHGAVEVAPRDEDGLAFFVAFVEAVRGPAWAAHCLKIDRSALEAL